MSRANQWFVPGDGIAREVITADIQRYLGPDALVKPGVGTGQYEGQSGYWITAYRTLTSQMIQDLKLDSQRWQAERGGGGVAYQDSRTHASRQHYGPSETYAPQPRQPAYQPSGYASEQPNYTTTPVPTYGQPHASYQPHQPHAAPRTYQDQYGQPTSGRTDYPYAYSQQTPNHPAQPGQSDPYNRPPTTQYQSSPSVVPQPGYYIASDGRQYPLAQQPQQQQQQPNPRRRA